MVGMTGMGGGSLMTPLLILIFGVKPVTAIGTDVFHAAILPGRRASRTGSTATSTSSSPATSFSARFRA